jgi:hypothetical protein
MTLAEMEAETFRRLRLEAVPVFWTAADVREALNEGYAELSDATEWYEQFVGLGILNDRPLYDLRTILGPSFLAIKPGYDEQTSRWLWATSIKQFDAHDRRWERIVGEPQRTFTRGLWWLGFYPRPHVPRTVRPARPRWVALPPADRLVQEAGVIKQYYTALPPPLVEDDDEPGFPESFHDGCIHFALTDLWAQDAESTRALKSWKDYLDTETRLQLWVDERASGPMNHVMGASQGMPGW